jgi:putative membrane protein
MKLTAILLAASATAAALGAVAQTRGTAPASQDPSVVTAEASPRQPTDRTNSRSTEFLLDALRASLTEARMGKLAAQQSYDEKVRDFGRKLESDHTAHAGEIERLLEPLGVTIPTEPSAEGLSQLAALTRLTGQEFDSAFVQAAIWLHNDAIEQYGAQTHANPDRSLHDFAARSLPMLREHLARAEALR